LSFRTSPLIAGRNAANMLFPSPVGAFLTSMIQGVGGAGY
jgi:hypothetical protein